MWQFFFSSTTYKRDAFHPPTAPGCQWPLDCVWKIGVQQSTGADLEALIIRSFYAFVISTRDKSRAVSVGRLLARLDGSAPPLIFQHKILSRFRNTENDPYY